MIYPNASGMCRGLERTEVVVKKGIRNAQTDQLFDAILSLKNRDECYTFFKDICTINELLSLGQRLDVGIRLIRGQTYQTIAGETGASTATISRVNRLLGDDDEGIEMAEKRLK